MDKTEICRGCKHATYDCYEYYGSLNKQWFIDGCRKGTEPYYDNEEECVTCDEYSHIKED